MSARIDSQTVFSTRSPYSVPFTMSLISTLSPKASTKESKPPAQLAGPEHSARIVPCAGPTKTWGEEEEEEDVALEDCVDAREEREAGIDDSIEDDGACCNS